jgi:pyruvate/2-oxoglutarate/acetoin dehydrogenase E1 component
MTGLLHLKEALSRHLSKDKAVFVGESAGCHGLSVGLPGRLLRLPLSEEGIVGVAVGMALTGQQVVVELRDPSGIGRAFSALHDAAGVADRAEGFPLSLVILVPAGERSPRVPAGVRLLAAAAPRDTADLLDQALSTPGIAVLLLSADALNGDLGASGAGPGARVRQSGSACTVLAWGPGVAAAEEAAATFEEGTVEVLDLRMLAPLDRPAVARSVQQTGRVVTVSGGRTLVTAVQEAFLYLKSPPVDVPAKASAIAAAIRSSIDY